MKPSLLKPVEWVGSSLADLREFPAAVQDVAGYALHLAQRGENSPVVKRLSGELAGLLEIVDDYDGNTFHHTGRTDDAPRKPKVAVRRDSGCSWPR